MGEQPVVPKPVDELLAEAAEAITNNKDFFGLDQCGQQQCVERFREQLRLLMEDELESRMNGALMHMVCQALYLSTRIRGAEPIWPPESYPFLAKHAGNEALADFFRWHPGWEVYTMPESGEIRIIETSYRQTLERH